MVGWNEAQRSDRMELPKHSDFQFCERRVFRQVEAVTALPCFLLQIRHDWFNATKIKNVF
jgi:hypothetical protein